MALTSGVWNRGGIVAEIQHSHRRTPGAEWIDAIGISRTWFLTSLASWLWLKGGVAGKTVRRYIDCQRVR